VPKIRSATCIFSQGFPGKKSKHKGLKIDNFISFILQQSTNYFVNTSTLFSASFLFVVVIESPSVFLYFSHEVIYENFNDIVTPLLGTFAALRSPSFSHLHGIIGNIPLYRFKNN
jgi:hypothetical protein